MKHTTKILLILALVAAAPLSVPGASHAQKSGGSHPMVVSATRPTELSASGPGAPAQQSWWGAAAKVGCREGIRYIGNPAFVMFSGFCGIWLLDVLIS